MSDLFGSRKPRAHWLRGIRVNEISLVDRGANDDARVVLAKSRDAINDAIATQSDDDILFAYRFVKEVMADEAHDRRRLRKRLRKMLRHRVAKADPDTTDGMSGGISHSESDRVGVQDDRSDQEHADDTAAILNEILRSPPIHSENWTRYSLRVFGQAALNEFTSDELNAARAAFQTRKGHLDLKALAAETLEKMAKSRAAQTGETFEKSYAEVAKTPEGRQFYGAMRGDGAALDLQRAAVSLSAGPSNRRNMLADAASMSPDECMQAINAHADKIQAALNCSRSSAILQAGAALPAHYQRSRSATKI